MIASNPTAARSRPPPKTHTSVCRILDPSLVGASGVSCRAHAQESRVMPVIGNSPQDLVPPAAGAVDAPAVKQGRFLESRNLTGMAATPSDQPASLSAPRRTEAAPGWR